MIEKSNVSDGSASKVSTNRVDLPPDIDGIVEVIRDILKQGGIQSIRLAKDEPIVYTRIAGEDDGHPFEGSRSYEELPISDIVRQRPMEEMPPSEVVLDGSQQLIRAMVYMSLRDYVVTHMVIGPSTYFWRWLKVDPLIIPRIMHICGAKIEVDKTLGPERVILCGARTKTASKSELEYSLVIFMEPEDGKKRAD